MNEDFIKRMELISYIKGHDKRYEKTILYGCSYEELVILKTSIEVKLAKRKKN